MLLTPTAMVELLLTVKIILLHTRRMAFQHWIFWDWDKQIHDDFLLKTLHSKVFSFTKNEQLSMLKTITIVLSFGIAVSYLVMAASMWTLVKVWRKGNQQYVLVLSVCSQMALPSKQKLPSLSWGSHRYHFWWDSYHRYPFVNKLQISNNNFKFKSNA